MLQPVAVDFPTAQVMRNCTIARTDISNSCTAKPEFARSSVNLRRWPVTTSTILIRSVLHCKAAHDASYYSYRSAETGSSAGDPQGSLLENRSLDVVVEHRRDFVFADRPDHLIDDLTAFEQQ